MLTLLQSLTRLLKAYDTSLEKNGLSDAMCGRYLDTLESLGRMEDALTVSSQATMAYPESVELWLQRLNLLSAAAQDHSGKIRKTKASRKKGEASVCDLCRAALDKVPKKVCVVYVC